MQHIDEIRDLTAYRPEPGAPGFTFVELDAGGHSLAPAPLFLFGPATSVVHDELFGQFATPRVGCYRLEQAGLAASGIPWQGSRAFTAPSLLHPRHLVSEVIGHMAHRALPVRHIAGTVAVIYGPGYQTFGHWLADFLPRLWVLAAAGHAIEDLFYALPPDLDEVAFELLFRIGISSGRVVRHDYLDSNLTADVLLVPTGLRLGNRLHPLFGEASRFWTDRVRPPRGAGEPRARGRLFLSRGAVAQQRVLVNREAVEAIAAERGFAVVSPERLPLAEQIALFSGASMIAGEYGSALHGSVFAGPRAITCGLRGNARHPSFVQSGMAAALGQHAGYVLGDTPRQDVEQRFSIDTDDFERALDIMEAQAAMDAG